MHARFAFAALTAAALSLHPLAAQQYSLFGFGCPGTGTNGPLCASNNPNASVRWGAGNSNQFALEVVASSAMTVTGFEIFTLSTAGVPIQIVTELYLPDASGTSPDLMPQRRSIMQVGTTLQFWSTAFAPLQVASGQRFYLSFADGRMDHPIDKGAGATLSIHFYRTPPSVPWNGPYTSFGWAFKVRCIGSGVGNAEPILTSVGLPAVNSSFDLWVVRAPASNVAFLLFGLSRTTWNGLPLPFSLAPFGAPLCNVLSSGEVVLVTPTDTNGLGKITFPVPNNPTLIGFTFYDQWIVSDPMANPLGFTVSNAGQGVIG